MTEQQLRQNISENLKQLRAEKGISQDFLAKKIGLTKAIMTNWEACKSTPSSYQLYLVAEYFETTVDYFFGEVF